MPIRMSETQVNETIARATRAAAADPRLRGGIKREKDLVNAIRDALGPDQTTNELQPKGLKGKSFEPTTGHQPINWDTIRDLIKRGMEETGPNEPDEQTFGRYPKRFSDRWLANNVPDMPSNEYSLLIVELGRRGWRKDEIVERVEAHRH